MRRRAVRLLAVAALARLSCCLERAPVASTPSARAPCPRRQLLTYFAYVGGRGATPAAVYARDATVSEEEEEGEWRAVGRVAAGTPEGADGSDEALLAAAALQRRLIVEHGCRLHKPLREAKRTRRGGTAGEEGGALSARYNRGRI